jgi:hypothetical protein
MKSRTILSFVLIEFNKYLLRKKMTFDMENLRGDFQDGNLKAPSNHYLFWWVE